MEEPELEIPAPRPPAGPKVRQVLMAQLAFCILGSLLGALVFQAIAIACGWDVDALRSTFSADAPPGQVWQMRFLLALSHLFTFVLAGWATVRVFYPINDFSRSWRLDWPSYLGGRQWPSGSVLGTGILIMLASLPAVLFSYTINKLVPLPEWVHQMENDTTEALKALLRMNGPLELLANLSLLAVLPAIGEELVFRGVLQRQLMRRIANPYTAILISAAIFSFVHFQFEGFLPRWLLGILLGWLYWRTGNFWVPVFAHFVNNALQVLGQYLYSKDLSNVNFEQDVDVPWAGALISVALLFALVRLLDRQLPAPAQEHSPDDFKL